MKKRILLFLLLFCLIFSAMSVGISALSPITAEGSIAVPIDGFDTYYGSTADVYNESYYNQLNAEQKNAYNVLIGLPKSDTTVTIDLITPITFTSQTNSPTSTETYEMMNKVTNIIQPALNAFLKDYPIIFWLNLSGGAGSTTYSVNYSGSFYSGKWHWEVTQILFYAAVADKYTPNTSTFVNSVTNEVASFETNSTSRYDILKDIHDYLCSTVVYDLNAVYAHEPYGALVTGRAVCEGYAEAFKLLCDRFNVPCTLIIGDGVTSSKTEAHMWNYVQMENGKWYGIDVTWDDQSIIRYDYFLAGADTVATYFGTKTFSQSHIEDGTFSSGSSMEFVYPVLNSTKYEQPIVDPCENGHTPGEWEVTLEPTYTEDGLKVKKCTVCGEVLESEVIPKLVLPSGDAELVTGSELIINSGLLLGLSDKVTLLSLTSEFDGDISVKSSTGKILEDDDTVGTGAVVDVGSITYTIVILGDVDGSGTISSKDYLMIKRAFLGTLALTETQLKAACIGGANKPTSLDYLKIKRHFLGTYNIYTT
ncbi:MAG TPA: hypothetical protein DCP51_03395 [Clostridiales bacterium]|nr:MAG: hypothetical protein A2Y40_06315 [Candidatus Margulisbacteria bacterium GWF2_35_9]HAN20709.1 hypothetical protein [Clostridiales bacterium]